MTTTRPTNADDIIDSRDVIAAIEELKDEIRTAEAEYIGEAEADNLPDLIDEAERIAHEHADDHGIGTPTVNAQIDD